jgi:plastocyanin
MKMYRYFPIVCISLLLSVCGLIGHAGAQLKNNKSACSKPNPAQLCRTSNTCGSSSTPCTVDIKRTADGASATPSVPNAKGNVLFCVNVGTTVTWQSTAKNVGFVVDLGPASPFEPDRAIIGGSDRSVSVVAHKPGCYRYSVGACMSGATYGMCKEGSAEVIVTASN